MAGDMISITAADLPALAAFAGQLGTIDTLPLMERIGTIGEHHVSLNFEGEHDPDGLPWAPSFRVRTQGGKTLSKYGHLSDSVMSNASADAAEIGTNMIYARIHNQGGVIQGNPLLRFKGAFGWASVESVTMPKRQFIGWGRDALDDVEAEAEEFLAGLLPGALQ